MPSRYKAESGKLIRFGGGTTEVLSPWPTPRGWIKGPNDRAWRHVRPFVRLPGSDIDRLISRQVKRLQGPMPASVRGAEAIALDRRRREDHLNFLFWARHIPSDIRRSISTFPDRHWHLLSMLACCGSAAHDLIRTNPALAYALASSWVFRQSPVTQPMRSIRALLRRGRKQRDILAWLDFPNSEAVRRILARVVPVSCRIPRLLYLRDACGELPVVKTLCHLDRINASVLRIVTDPALRERTGFDVLKRLSGKKRQDRRPHLAWVLKDFDRMCAESDIRPPRIWTLDIIERTLDEMLENIGDENDSLCSSLENMPFPVPPVPGNRAIVPITDATMLREEGAVQKHCIVAYGRAIAVEKNTYIYRLLEPERATVELARSDTGWKIGQVKGFRNRAVSREAHRAVRRWLESMMRGCRQSAGQSAIDGDSGRIIQGELSLDECQSTGA